MALSSSRRRGRISILVGALRRAPRRLLELSLGEAELLLEAPFALPLSGFALRRYGLRRLQALLSHGPVARSAPANGVARAVEAQRLAWIVQVVAAYSPWRVNCLQRSVILWWFLRRRGLQGELRIGVRRADGASGLDFHAWVEHDGVAINDRRDVRQRYATFDQAIAPRGAAFH